MGNSFPPACAASGHTSSTHAVAAYVGGNSARIPLQPAMYQRYISLFDFAPGELVSYFAMRKVILCNDDKPAGFFIEAVDNSRPRFAAQGRQSSEVMEQCIHQRATVAQVLGCSGSGMNHHPRRFIDDGQVIILVKN